MAKNNFTKINMQLSFNSIKYDHDIKITQPGGTVRGRTPNVPQILWLKFPSLT